MRIDDRAFMYIICKCKGTPYMDFVTSACALYVYGQHLETEFNIMIITIYIV